MTIKDKYTKLETDRNPYLRRARSCAAVTIPSLFPEEGFSDTSGIVSPNQSLGSRGVNNLASKLLLTLFPPNSGYFRMTVDDFQLQELTGKEDVRAQVEEALGRYEAAVSMDFDKSAARVRLFLALKHLIIAGNICVYTRPDGGLKLFTLDQYVVSRDGDNNVMDIITKESMSYGALPDEIRSGVTRKTTSEDGKGKEDDYDLYTHVSRGVNGWSVTQEVEGITVKSEEDAYPLDTPAHIPLRMVAIDGEDYGRSYVEEIYGDLLTLESQSGSLSKAGAAAARLLWLINPSGVTDENDLEEAPDGSYVPGNADDITALSFDKIPDFQFVASNMRVLEERLAYAFLLNSSVKRQAERVTAEEIRYMAAELEEALGGVYSVLSVELQLPLVKYRVHLMESNNKLPKLPKEAMNLTITTGLTAIGRGHDLSRLDTFIDRANRLGEQVVAERVDTTDYLKRVATALNLDANGLVRTEEEIRANNDQEQQRRMAETMTMQQAGQQPQPQQA